MKKKFNEVDRDFGITMPDVPVDAEKMLNDVRFGKVKNLWESLKNAGLVTIEKVSNFFLSMGNAIKEFLVGGEEKSGIIPEPIKKVLSSMYEFVINAVKTALSFISRIFKSGKAALTTTITLPGGNEVKAYTLIALAAIGSIITLGVYKVVQTVRRQDVETEPKEMEESIKSTCEAFEKSKYLFDGLENLKEEDGFAHDQVQTLVEKASYVANDVVNFADPDVEPEEEESKLAAFFKKFRPFVLIVAVATAFVVIGKKIFGERIDPGLDISLPQNVTPV